MPCFNAASHIAAGVATVLQQTLSDIELIVVDDGSTDRSAEILRGFSDGRLTILTQENKGVLAARNAGLAAASGQYVAFLDADDTWRPDCLEKLHRALAEHPECVLAYCGWQNLGLPGNRGNPFIPPDYEVHNKAELLLDDCRWPVHGALTRRDAVVAAGGFDPNFPTAEDYWLWLRIAVTNKIIRVPEVLAYYHHHGEQRSTARNQVQKAFNRWQIRNEFLKRHPEIAARLGNKRIRELTHGNLLKWGYKCYWADNLEAARAIFRLVMKQGYGSIQDWKYMLPALLPLFLHRALLHRLRPEGGARR
jgi:glycosyltransferase involved in cell wall biosynthesis